MRHMRRSVLLILLLALYNLPLSFTIQSQSGRSQQYSRMYDRLRQRIDKANEVGDGVMMRISRKTGAWEPRKDGMTGTEWTARNNERVQKSERKRVERLKQEARLAREAKDAVTHSETIEAIQRRQKLQRQRAIARLDYARRVQSAGSEVMMRKSPSTGLLIPRRDGMTGDELRARRKLQTAAAGKRYRESGKQRRQRQARKKAVNLAADATPSTSSLQPNAAGQATSSSSQQHDQVALQVHTPPWPTSPLHEPPFTDLDLSWFDSHDAR